MHKLNRQSAPNPVCLANYSHGVNTWKDVSPADKAAIRGCLEAMQGRRCAYCEAPVDQHGYHIEHFRRKSMFQNLTFAWENLLLCCSRNDCCGHHKDRAGWPYNPDDLVNPTIDEPDHFFYFRESGVVDVRSGCNQQQAHRANETLRVLNLKHHGPLRSMRARQLQWYKDKDPDVFDELMKLPEEDRRAYVMEELNATSDQSFCTIIRHFLQGLLS
jgi:uncharacterized protein (TIGR02646 family)